MKIKVAKLLNSDIGSVEDHQLTLDKKAAGLWSKDLVVLGGLVEIRLTLIDEDGILAEGKVSVKSQLECVRCLTAFETDLSAKFSQVYRLVPGEGDLSIINDKLDISEPTREELLIAVPMKPICRDDCKGLCAVCGLNLNEKDCGHKQEQPGSPFAKLESIKDKLKEKE